MDAIRVSKVEGVHYTKTGTTFIGTIHLTAHHLIYNVEGGNEKEIWVPYPLISLVTRLPQTLSGQSPLTFHTRTFEIFSLSFNRDVDANDVFESIKELTVAISVNQLYAFFYTPNPALPTSNGWSLYSPRDEFGRMGVGTRSKAWRFTDLNKEYSFCPTYPSRLVVPTRISDATLQYASKYRSKNRIPVLTYLHWANYGSITRSSQPMVGITQNRSIQDEKLIEAIFQTHWSPESRASNTPVYGATCTNLIIDARPTANAVANTAKGAGTENMEHYKEGKKVYLGIDHIHTMRESLAKVVEALREANALSASINNNQPEMITSLSVLDRQALRRSGWLRHISAMLEGTVLIVRNIHINSSHVLIHCSDGWDRTSQLSSITQLCLDPFYRTIRGFEILIEKDWISYGHKFLDRCGHLSSEKFFISLTENTGASGGADAAQAFLASVQNRFASQQHLKETSPIFHQFLEAVRQIQRQFPERFEFNEQFLRKLYYHLYSCQFGTFLYNTERERRSSDRGPPPCERTFSVWDFLNYPSEMEQIRNPDYDPSLDDPTSRAPKADMGVLFPNPKDVRFWNELYGRTDDEMNGRVRIPNQTPGADVTSTIEGAEDDQVLNTFDNISTTSLSQSPTKSVGSLVPPRSPGIRQSPLRSNSPSLREPSASVPDITKGIPQRNDGPNLISSSPSTPTPFKPSNLPSAQSSLPIWSRTKTPDLGGVKSVWGKLSSNASAAFSVVHEAYNGVARDLRNNEGPSEASYDRNAELRSRDTLSTWGEGGTQPMPTTSLAALTLNNPWSLPVENAQTKVALDENPWSLTQPPREAVTDKLYEPSASSSLPLDPTISIPANYSQINATSGTQIASANQVSTHDNDPVRKDTLDTSHQENTDPLGVGLR